jgi:hypothetical protein
MKSLFSTMVVLVAGAAGSACDKPVQVQLADPAPVKVVAVAAVPAGNYCQQAKVALANANYANTVQLVAAPVRTVRVVNTHAVAVAATHNVAVVNTHTKVGLAAPANNGVNVTVVNQPQQRQGFLGRLLGRNRTKTKVVVRQ